MALVFHSQKNSSFVNDERKLEQDQKVLIFTFAKESLGR